MPDLWERFNMENERKPKGFGNFTELLRKIASVPKEIVSQRIAAKKATRKPRSK
jgi:hypothetical protein